MPRPTRVPDAFATDAGTRVAPTAGRLARGYEAGLPVPPLTHNDQWGLNTDWIRYMIRGGEVIPIPPTVASVQDATSGTIVNDFISLDITAGGAGAISMVWPTVWCAGTATSITVRPSGITNDIVNVNFRLYDSTWTSGSATCTTANRTYTSADNGTAVTQTFTTGTTTLAGPVFIAASMTFTGAHPIVIDLLQLNIGA